MSSHSLVYREARKAESGNEALGNDAVPPAVSCLSGVRGSPAAGRFSSILVTALVAFPTMG